MKTFAYIRLLSYVACIAVFLLIARDRRAIPVTFWSEEDQEALDDRRDARKHAAVIPSHRDFRHTRLSGSAVVAAAMAAAKREGDDLRNYGEPQVLLKEKDGRLVWFVSFYHIPNIPGAFFTVGIEDDSGEATIYPGM